MSDIHGQNIHLTINNHGGSVEHYYHFLLGFFVPLLMAWRDLTRYGHVRHIYVRSCAVLDDIILAARCPEIVITDKAAHQAMRESGRGPDGVPLRLVTVEGYDSPDKYPLADFAGVAEVLRRHLGDELAEARAAVAAGFPGEGPRVALIDRAKAHPFYASDAAEIKTAGAERRSIGNVAALEAVLRERGVNLLACTLEGTSLAHQMALFEQADVVIAQHGAALSNQLWGRPSLRVVEIMPQDVPELILNADFFGALARRLGQECRKVTQATSHGPVDIAAIVAAVEAPAVAAYAFAELSPDSPAETSAGTGGSPMEDVTIKGDADASPLTRAVKAAFTDALARYGRLPEAVLGINGMSGRKYRYFINNLIGRIDRPRYLEVGSWAGSTLCSAIAGNRLQAVAVDDWSQFGGPAAEFFANVSRFSTKDVRLSVLTSDFRQADVRRLGPFNVYLFDGPHGYQDQYDGLAWAIDQLDEEFVFIVDDWNWERVRNGTFAAMGDLSLLPVLQFEVRSTLDESHGRPAGKESDWHNGYFIAVLRKGESLLQRWRRRLLPPHRVAGETAAGPAPVTDPAAALGPQLHRLQRAPGVNRGADGAVTIPHDCDARHALFGPYVHLAPGNYRLTACLTAAPVSGASDPETMVARVEVCAAYGETLGMAELTPALLARQPVVIPFTIPEQGDDWMIEFRVVHFEQANLRVLGIELEADEAPSPHLWKSGQIDYLLGPLLPRLSLTGAARRTPDGDVTVAADAPCGHVLYGPYLRLPTGAYRLQVRAAVSGADGEDGPALGVEVVAGGGPALGEITITAQALRQGPATLSFTLPPALAVDGATPQALEVRLSRLVPAAMTVLAVDLMRQLPD